MLYGLRRSPPLFLRSRLRGPYSCKLAVLIDVQVRIAGEPCTHSLSSAGRARDVVKHADMPLILARIAQGEYIAHVAKDLGIPKTTLDYRVRTAPKGLQAIRKGAVKRLAIAKRLCSKSISQSLRTLDGGGTVNASSLARAQARLAHSIRNAVHNRHSQAIDS